MDELKPCPFCGNSSTDPRDLQRLEIIESKGQQWGRPAARLYFVRCGRCYAQGGKGAAGYNALSGTDTSDDRARQIAIENWNRREHGKDTKV